MKLIKKHHHLLLSQKSYILISSIIMLSIYCSTRNNTESITGTQSCLVTSIIDGDTVTAACNSNNNRIIRIRLEYIDAPETKQYWGQKSTEYLRQLLSKMNNHAKIVFNGKDIYQRHLGVITTKHKSVNIRMIEQGMARVYKQYQPPHGYIEAMKKAQSQKIGIWSTKGLHQNPQRFRRLSH